jgi:delta 1-pyrroline-5-carboxylate dehydrogenase
MAISVVLAVGEVGDELVDRIASRARELKTGDGRRGCDMGPLVTSAAQSRVTSYIEQGETAGAKLVVDGRQTTFDADGNGFFVGPTLFDHVTTDMSIYTDEIFGPVLSVVRVDSYDERQPVRQRDGHLHQRRRGGPALLQRDRGGDGRRQRARPCPGRLLQLRGVEELPLR